MARAQEMIGHLTDRERDALLHDSQVTKMNATCWILSATFKSASIKCAELGKQPVAGDWRSAERSVAARFRDGLVPAPARAETGLLQGDSRRAATQSWVLTLNAAAFCAFPRWNARAEGPFCYRPGQSLLSISRILESILCRLSRRLLSCGKSAKGFFSKYCILFPWSPLLPLPRNDALDKQDIALRLRTRDGAIVQTIAATFHGSLFLRKHFALRGCYRSRRFASNEDSSEQRAMSSDDVSTSWKADLRVRPISMASRMEMANLSLHGHACMYTVACSQRDHT